MHAPAPEGSSPENISMEVHHHGHVHHDKKWKEYLFQFFMLFLAVFLGSLAEYRLEHHIEHNREKQFAAGVVSDLKADTTNAQIVVNDFVKSDLPLDSIINFFDEMMGGHPEVVLRNVRFVNRFEDFRLTDGTMQQLKNAGGLRLIRNREISDSIMHYDAVGKDVLSQQEHLGKNIFVKMWDAQNACFDDITLDSLVAIHGLDSARTFMQVAAPAGRREYAVFYQRLKSLKRNFTYWISYLTLFKQQGARLIGQLQDEYDL